MTSPISVSKRGGIAHIVLSRPDARNALNLDMCNRLEDAFVEMDADDEIRVVLLQAAGAIFSAGADLKERRGKSAAWVRHRRMRAFAAYNAIEKCRKPVIAVVQGPAIGSGGEMAMCCDFIIASSMASFQFPEVKWGTVGATQRLQRAIGKRSAKELLYTGRVMSVQEAHNRGLVARLVPAEELEATVGDIAESIAAAPALSVRLTKQSIDLGERTDLDTGVRIELAAIDHCLSEDGWRDGVERFVAGDENGAKQEISKAADIDVDNAT